MEVSQKVHRSSKALLIVGFIAITASFLAYWNNAQISVTPSAMPALQRLAIATYVILLISFGAIGLSLYRFYKSKVSSTDNFLSSIIARAINDKRTWRIFVITSIGYGIFFAFTSGMILYKPELNATDFGFPTPPHAELAPCCGLPGYMPMFLAFFTEHIGIQIIPLNLVLLVVMSFLVGLNFAMSLKVFTISRSRKSGGMSSVGAATGLFVGCPTCAGTLFFLLTGLWTSTTAVSTALFLTTYQVELQSMFIAISIPVLVVTILIMARNLRKSQLGSCAVDFKQ